MTPFWLFRDEDVSGQSGTGWVAEGVIFSDGKVAMRWLTDPTSTACYDSIEDVEAIHGHNGRTHVITGNRMVLVSEPETYDNAV